MGESKTYNGVFLNLLNDKIDTTVQNAKNIGFTDKDFAKSGFRIINNCGDDGGQEVKHIHYHVLAGKK